MGAYAVKPAVVSYEHCCLLSAPEKRCLEPLNVACSPPLSLVNLSPAFFPMSIFSGCSFTFLYITFLFYPDPSHFIREISSPVNFSLDIAIIFSHFLSTDYYVDLHLAHIVLCTSIPSVPSQGCSSSSFSL